MVDNQENAPKIIQAQTQYSNAQEIWRLYLLSIATGALYLAYWFYRNCKHFKEHNAPELKPGLATLGLLIPFANVFLIYGQLKDIYDNAKRIGIEAKYSPILLNGGLLVSASQLDPNSNRWLVFLVFDFLFAWLLTIPQKVLNSYWEKQQPGLPVRKYFTKAEIITLFLGGLFFAFLLLPERFFN